MLGRIMKSLSEPSSTMSWAQLAGATVFVIAVALMWRQVTFFIMREI